MNVVGQKSVRLPFGWVVRRRWLLSSACVPALLLALGWSGSRGQEPTAESAEGGSPGVVRGVSSPPASGPEVVHALPPTVQTFIENHCLDCHDGEEAEGELDLAALKLNAGDPVSIQRWTRVLERVHDGEMPPKRKRQPAEADRSEFLASLDKTLLSADLDRQSRLGRTLGRRLTRAEYENTLADLLGVRIPLSSELPSDPYSYIFDTVAAGQDVSPQLLERYQAAAEMVLDAAFERATGDEKPWSIDLSPKEFARRRTGINGRDPILRKTDAAAWATTLAFHGRMTAFEVPADGWYRIKINAFAINPPESGIVWSSLQNGVCQASEPALNWIGSVPASREPQDFVFEAWMEKGHTLELRPADGNLKTANFASVIDTGLAEEQGVAGIAIRSVALERIDNGASSEQVRRMLFANLRVTDNGPVSSSPDADLQRLIGKFADRAFRRPVLPEEFEPYVSVAQSILQSSGSFSDALRAGYRAVLFSPRFLYLQEQPGKLDDHALASRLSYLFWRTMPDDALRAAADEGRLSDPTELREQVERLLNDPRAERFVANFTDQWLNLRDIDATQPDRKLYPEFDPILQGSMLAETRGFFAELLKRDLSVLNFVDSDFAMLDGRLADHYGVPPGVVGPGGVRPVELQPEWNRGGLLGQAAIHKVTANGTTTSPILRGVWVLERLLGQHVAPPPPNIPAVEPDIRGATTIREQLEKHRASEACATCHVKIDPPGFALESYDVIGGWRDRYRVVSESGKRDSDGPVVDTHYQTADGEAFEDIKSYKQILLRDPNQIATCVAQKLLVYGTGAGISYADRKAVEQIVEQTRAKDFGLRSIVHATVQSKVFQSK